MAEEALGQVSMSDLQREIARRKKLLPSLKKKKDKLARQLAEVDAQLAQWGADAEVPPRRGRKPGPRKGRKPAAKARRGRKAKRTANAMSLAARLAEVMKGAKPMSIAEAAAAAIQAGHQTAAKNFRLLVNQTLSRGKAFRTAGRGRYALKTERKAKAASQAPQEG